LLTAAILNKGQLVEPTIVDRIVDENGRVLYRSHRMIINRAVSPETSETVNSLMKATIRSGTSRKAFSGRGRDRILSRLNIGSKTGSINSKTHDTRYDWFVGFAREINGPEAIAVSVVVAHEKYIGTRAGQYARIAIKRYFRNYFSKQKT
jgi:cell division protein FtsI/penicillin-binding protein 2